MRSRNHLLKTGENVRCEICELLPVSGPDYDKHLLTEEHLGRVASAAPLRKIRCETCNIEFTESGYENHLESQIHNIDLNRGDIRWRMCEICNVEIRSTILGTHVRSKSHLNKQSRLPIQEERNFFPAPKKLAVSSLKKQHLS